MEAILNDEGIIVAIGQRHLYREALKAAMLIMEDRKQPAEMKVARIKPILDRALRWDDLALEAKAVLREEVDSESLQAIGIVR